MKTVTRQCRLALLGQAVGDAFGAPFEYHPRAPELAQLSMGEGRYLDPWDDCGQRKVGRLRLPGLYTDDTQQALALVKARLEADTPAAAAEHFRDTVVRMADPALGSKSTFGVHRGTGSNFRLAVTTRAPVDTAGLGAAMRVGPAATLSDDPQEAVEWTVAVSRVTTSNPIALACAAKFAAVAWILAHPDRRAEVRGVRWPEDGIPPEVWTATTAALRVVKAEGEGMLCQFAASTGWSDKPVPCAACGFALPGFAWAVNQALAAPSFRSTMVTVCQSGGDTDTVAAMAGCLAALRHGGEGVPNWMVTHLVGADGVLDPERWDPVGDEAKLTALDEEYRTRRAAMAAPKDAGGPVLFGRDRSSPYAAFSNFHPARFKLDGEEWPDVEHYFVAQKNPGDADFQRAVRATADPAEVKRLGRRTVLREGWDDRISRDVMFQAVQAKFEQNPGLRALLLSTGDRPIHEDRPDAVWGGGPNFPEGKDWLGQVLSDVRDLLRGGA